MTIFLLILFIVLSAMHLFWNLALVQQNRRLVALNKSQAAVIVQRDKENANLGQKVVTCDDSLAALEAELRKSTLRADKTEGQRDAVVACIDAYFGEVEKLRSNALLELKPKAKGRAWNE
jgi:hypothetical protein